MYTARYPHPAGRIVGPQDELLALYDEQTIIASGNGPIVDLGENFAPAPDCAVSVEANVSAIKTSVGDETYSFTLWESADCVTWTTTGATRVVTATGTARMIAGVTKRFVRAIATLAGTLPSITLSAWINRAGAR